MATTPENIAEIQKATADFGMEVASMSASLKPQVKDGESLMTHYDKIVADCKAVGTDLYMYRHVTDRRDGQSG